MSKALLFAALQGSCSPPALPSGRNDSVSGIKMLFKTVQCSTQVYLCELLKHTHIETTVLQLKSVNLIFFF